MAGGLQSRGLYARSATDASAGLRTRRFVASGGGPRPVSPLPRPAAGGSGPVRARGACAFADQP
jgi:hypothetical protein